MVAAIGMIVPDLFGRFGGYLSPSMDLMLECFLFILSHVSGHVGSGLRVAFLFICFHIFSCVLVRIYNQGNSPTFPALSRQLAVKPLSSGFFDQS